MENKIVALEREINAMKQTGTFPYPIDRALIGRGYLKNIQTRQIDTDATVYPSLFREISLTGNPEVITVPQYPWRYLRLEGAQNYYVPVMVVAEF